MTIVINGTTGISGVDGSAGTPAVQGTDTNTGVFYPAADTVGVSTGGSERVRVDSSGNVGIGTTNTTDQRLKVKQSADTGASSFSFKVEANANDTGLYIGYRGAGAATAADTCAITATYGSTGAFKPMTFLTSDAERMRIDSSGNVGIGTSSPAVKLHVSGGTQRIQSTGSTSDAVLTLQNDVGTQAILGLISSGNSPANTFFIETNGGKTVYVTSTGLFQFNNGYGSAATAYGCRAWVNFNGTGTVAIRASGNVSSITDGGVGIYRVNFTSSMPDANFTTVASSAGAGTVNGSTTAMLVNATSSTAQTANVAYVDVWCYHPGNQVAQDDAYINVSVFR